MEKIGCLLLAFGFLLALSITGPEFSANAARPTLGDSKGFFLQVSEDQLQDVSVPLNPSGDFVRQPIEDKSADETKKETLDLEIESIPGFDILNSLDGISVEVQCFNDNIPSAPNLIDQIIPVGGWGSWNLDNIDPGNIHVKYRCHFRETSSYRWRYFDWEVWTDHWDRGLMPFYCIHCLYKVANDGLYVQVPDHAQAPYNFIKLGTWLLEE